jgi:hypothetical protein
MGGKTRLLAGGYGSQRKEGVVHLHCVPVYLLCCPRDEACILPVSSVTVGGGCGRKRPSWWCKVRPNQYWPFVIPWDGISRSCNVADWLFVPLKILRPLFRVTFHNCSGWHRLSLTCGHSEEISSCLSAERCCLSQSSRMAVPGAVLRGLSDSGESKYFTRNVLRLRPVKVG